MMKPPQIKTGKKSSPTGLNEIWIEIGIDCDLRCSYCFNSAGGIRKEKKILKVNDYWDLLKQFKKMGGTTVGLPGAGEPLYGKNLKLTLAILDFCNKNDLHLVIFTHGQNISDNLIKKINRPNVSLMIKYNSAEPKIQDKLVGVGGYTEKRNKVISKLIKAGFAGYKNGFSRLGFVTSILEQNYQELPAIFSYCRENGIVPDFDTILEAGRAKHKNISFAKVKKMMEKLQQLDQKKYGYEWQYSPTYITGCCDRYKRHLYIDRFGQVSPCLGAAINKVILGNIKKEKLSQMWELPLMKTIRQRKYSGECAKCKKFKNRTCNSCLGRFVDNFDGNCVATIGCEFKL